MPNNYILTSDGGFASTNELYHAVRKGEQKKDHKYISREWKNGRWNYYYDDNSGKRQGLSLVDKIVDATGSNAKKRYEEYQQNGNSNEYERIRNEYKKAYAKVTSPDIIIDPKTRKYVINPDRPTEKDKQNYNKLANDLLKAESEKKKVASEYQNSFVGKVDKGRKYVADTLKRIDAKVKETTKKVDAAYKDFKESCKAEIDKGREAVSNWFSGFKNKYFKSKDKNKESFWQHSSMQTSRNYG